MKLWYQSTSRQMWGAYNRVLRELLDGVRDPETQIEVHGIRSAGNVLRDLEELERETVLANVRRAAQMGFEAFLIGSIADPGLAEARELVDIPVLGLGETALHVAGMIGSRLAIVAIGESRASHLIENASRYGFTEKLAAVEELRIDRRNLQLGFDDLDTRHDLVGQFQRIGDIASRAGADVIIAASSMMMALLAYAQIDETAAGTPIVDGIAHLVKLGEMAIKVNRVLGGRFTEDRIPIAVELLRSYDAIPRSAPGRGSTASVVPSPTVGRFKAS